MHDAFCKTLKDLHHAEKPPELKQAFERLVQLFEILGRPKRAKTCETMQGLFSEMEEDLATPTPWTTC